MMRKHRLSILAVGLILCTALCANAQNGECSDSGAPGDFSKSATSLCWQQGNEVRHLNIWSPDHSVLLKVDGDKGTLYRNGKVVGQRYRFLADAEWLWSPDSKAAILTTLIISPAPVVAGLTIFGSEHPLPDVTKTIRKDFSRNHPNLVCARQVNVAGLTWLERSKQAVLVAEVPPSPRCDKADGYFEAYVISVPKGEILVHYSMQETIKRFHDVLGPGLLEDIEAQKEERATK